MYNISNVLLDVAFELLSPKFQKVIAYTKKNTSL